MTVCTKKLGKKRAQKLATYLMQDDFCGGYDADDLDTVHFLRPVLLKLRTLRRHHCTRCCRKSRRKYYCGTPGAEPAPEPSSSRPEPSPGDLSGGDFDCGYLDSERKPDPRRLCTRGPPMYPEQEHLPKVPKKTKAGCFGGRLEIDDGGMHLGWV